MKNTIFAVLTAVTGLAGCAEHPKNIEAAYIPSIIYKGASCSELLEERGRLAGYVRNMATKQQNSANWDSALVTTSSLIFWPALIGLPFTRDQQAQLAVARGHYDALMQAGRKYGCGPDFIQPLRPRQNSRQLGEFPPM